MTEAERMVAKQIALRGITDPRVLDALRRVPRHEFVPLSLRPLAYRDQPLSIGQGQTISQPYIVAYMTECLGLRPGDRVLEVGTGCGYQTAVLAELCAEVYTIEVIESLGKEAKERLGRLGYGGIRFRIGDGSLGWPEAAPFESIIVTAAASRPPPALIDQLVPGGRMIIPLGGPCDVQDLVLIGKKPGGGYETRNLLAVRFVPLVMPNI
jgi:protein-L-isoaspartate(D-aspartate) O-methyltransferase